MNNYFKRILLKIILQRIGKMASSFPLTSPIEITGTGLNPGQINISDGTNVVEVKAPSTLSSTVDFTLPDSNGTTGQFLQRTGATSLGWTTNPGVIDSTLPLTVKLTNRNGAPSQTTSATFAIRGNIIYGGTTSDNPITKIEAIVETNADTTEGQVQIFDLTNANIIATSAIYGPQVGGLSRTIIDLGTISNLPTTQAIFEIQLRRVTGTGNAQLHTCQFYA